MKKSLAIIGMLLIHFLPLMAQKPASGAPIMDTIGHLRDKYIKNKDRYVNKSLDVLLHDLDLKVAYYMISSPHNDSSVCNTLMLSFWDRHNTVQGLTTQSLYKPPIINITWATPVPRDKAIKLLAKNKTLGEWDAQEESFYGKLIVKRLVLTEYPKTTPPNP